ncbi:MAG: protocatechuate 3,4-dioxygenase [Myxococcaceae bacterium]|nr:protocatechuate 3,4-dioxygenase [Myxococcaceae bacterium]
MSDHRSTRRQVLQAFGGLGALALLDCGGTAAASSGGGSGATGGGTAAGGGTASGSWASQGTSILSGKDYGNPFASGIGTTCNVYKSATEGPCHATSPLLTRKDVSEGYPGLPMRLELLVVNKSCAPVPNATVEIWMCDTKGVYSGDIDGNNDAFCTGGSATAAAALWGRGIQTAGSDGRVTFDANFPGWYSGRTTHIHFKVSVGATAYITSQLFFDDAFKKAIYDAQPSYKLTSGQGYVTNANDMVVTQSGLSLAEAVCSTAQQSDGALLAWKAITVNA